MKRLTFLSIAVCMVILIAFNVVAQERGKGAGKEGGRGRLFKEADVNNDGKVTLEELQAIRPGFAKERFDRMDRNKDGFITKEERPGPGAGRRKGGGNKGGKGKGKRRAGGLPAADTDNDGIITREEFYAALPVIKENLFNRLDENNDGILDKKEVLRRGAGRGQGLGGEQGRRSGAFVQKLKAADRDQDGRVTKDEFAAGLPNAPEKMFGNLDKNSDSAITKDEYPKAAPDRNNRRQNFQKQIKSADTDGDGKVTREEFKKAFPKSGDKVFDRLDRNSNGIYDKADRAMRNMNRSPGKKVEKEKAGPA